MGEGLAGLAGVGVGGLVQGVGSGPKANNEEGCNGRRPTMLQWPEADKATMAGGRQINISVY